MSKDTKVESKNDWQPLRELALKTPYTMEYLSLMARRKQLKVKKVGRLWYSTLNSIHEFEKEMQARKEKKREKMRAKYFRKAEKQPAKIRVSQAAIFDQIQGELEEVLAEIREKERRLREDYHEGISRVPFRVAAAVNSEAEPKIITEFKKKEVKGSFLRKEKQETEDLSEKLIMDLGKLLNTANQIQEDVEIHHNKEEYRVPVKSRSSNITAPAEVPSQEENHGTPFLSLNYPDQHRVQSRSQVEIHDYAFPMQVENGPGWANRIIILVVSILVFIAILLLLFLVFGSSV
jgi:hypothetical protein